MPQLNSIFGERTHLITDIHTYAPLNLEGATGSKLQIILSAPGSEFASFQIHAQPIEQARTWIKLAEGQVELGKADAHWLYKLRWELKPISDTARSTAKQNGTWIIFSDQKGLGAHLSELLDCVGNNPLTSFADRVFDQMERTTQLTLKTSKASNKFWRRSRQQKRVPCME